MQRERRQRRGNPEITAVSEQRKEKPLMKIASRRRRRRKAEIMKQTGRWVLVSDEGLKGEAMKGTDNEGEKLE